MTGRKQQGASMFLSDLEIVEAYTPWKTERVGIRRSEHQYCQNRDDDGVMMYETDVPRVGTVEIALIFYYYM